jgi:hypothetical protein
MPNQTAPSKVSTFLREVYLSAARAYLNGHVLTISLPRASHPS